MERLWTAVAGGVASLWLCAISVVLALACALPAQAGNTVDVYVYNTDFSTNLPGQPIQQAVISVGDSVRWVWLQGNHTTTSVAGIPEQWDELITSSNQFYTHTFTHEGVFWYYCAPHGADNGDGTAGGMAGNVTVLPAGPGACCVGEMCMELSPAQCLTQGGTYQGDGTKCEPMSCMNLPTTIMIAASKDNILYETIDGSVSNALGRYLYAGNQSTGARRRSVIAFDLSEIPLGAVVQSAELRLFCNSAGGASVYVNAHRLLANWGEGASTATGNEGTGAPVTSGDATWLHRFYPHPHWSTPGGDFIRLASASTEISAPNTFYTWTSETLIDDVQHWVSMPSMNHGWILRGDEAVSANTKRFDSRNGPTPANHPKLIVTYLPPDPIGACCMADGSCDTVSESHCLMMGGTYWGNGSMCHMVSCPIELEPFVDALPRPTVATPVSGKVGGAAHYEIAMTEQMQPLHRDLPPTRVWGFDGSFPGPTIEAWRDEQVTVVWKNDLRVHETGELRTVHALPVDECLHGPDMSGQTPLGVVHLHGGTVPADSDGHPEDAFPPGQQSSLHTYPNIQPAAMLWYHDHSLGITRLNVMMGLAGLYIIRDEDEAALNLPSDEYEIPLAIMDRSFHPDGSLKYPEMWHEHFFGDFILVNGKIWPYLHVDRGKYRMRMVNASNSRAYTLALSDDATFWQIGSDLGLLETPLAMTEVTFLPGERLDLVFDFAKYAPGTEIILTNSAPSPYPGYPGVGVVPNVMKFIVGKDIGHTDPLSKFLVEVPRIEPSEAVIERVLDLRLMPNHHCSDHHDGMWTIDGLMWDDITEFPVLGTTEIWTWRNDSGMSHPMHIHLVKTQVINRQAIDPLTGDPTGPLIPPAPNEMGWKDTVDAPPGYFTRVIARFEHFTGLFAYHCHILEHEDHEMMRQFMVVPPRLLGDLNDDGVVNVSDLLLLFGQWGPCAGCAADLNHDGSVNVSDLLILFANWG